MKGLVVLPFFLCSWALLANSITNEEKDAMLDRHNYHRSRIARGLVDSNPPGADIVLLEWEERSVKSSFNWASHCLQRHNTNKARRFGSYETVGQNIASFVEVNASMVKAVDLWYNEINYFNYTKLSCSGICGHYTQVIWSSSAVIGCANAYCPNSNLQSNIVCEYAPGGNWDGEHPYKVGPACSQCPSNYPKCYNGLCAMEAQCTKYNLPCTNSTVTDQALTREATYNPENINVRFH
jgi:hypothetical protein